jgi:3-phytase
MTKLWSASLLAAAAVAGAGCTSQGGQSTIPGTIAGTLPGALPPSTVTVAPAAETAPTSDANAAVLVLSQTGQTRVLGTGGAAGIEIYGLNGARIAAAPAGTAAGVDARYGVPGAPGADLWTIAALDEATNRLRFFSFDAATGTAADRTARDIDIGFAGESLCLYRDAVDRNLYAFALGGAGEIAQYAVFAQGGRLDARLVRRFHVASEASYCTTYDASGDLYVAEQAVGIWRFPASPEAETVPQLIDAVRLGRIAEETGGLAIYDAGAANYLIASNASANTFHVYDRKQDHRHVGSFQLGASGGIDAVEAAGGLHASAIPAGARFPAGVLIATDDSDDAGMNYKIVSWADIAGALDLASGTPGDPRRPSESSIAAVSAVAETPPVEAGGDAADDPAIWVHPRNPALTLVIGTQKQSGLYVYDLSGAALQFLPDGRMNNVDVRDGFRFGGQTAPLVAASNRTNDSISLYRIDPQTRRLAPVADGVQPTGFADPYGLCMYRSAASGKFYVFVNDTNGAMKQWELVDARNGRVRTQLVREFAFGGQAEGCVADDETGILYVAEEDVGLWRMRAEPDGGIAKTSIATVENNAALEDDLEGIAIYKLEGGRGYLVLSSQGNNTYAVFRREGDNSYVGSFAVAADSATGIDGVSETDGLDVSSASLGSAFAHGLFVAQDGRNVAPPENQNFKFVPWSAIAAALRLDQR